MRYCNQCHRITPGEPLFCNLCGRSYDFKLCPHRHPNPRNAEVCSECGSPLNESSQTSSALPQPAVPASRRFTSDAGVIHNQGGG